MDGALRSVAGALLDHLEVRPSRLGAVLAGFLSPYDFVLQYHRGREVRATFHAPARKTAEPSLA